MRVLRMQGGGDEIDGVPPLKCFLQLVSILDPNFDMGKIKGERGKAWKGEDPQENWEKGQVLRICRGVGVVPSRVIRDEYRI